MKTKIKIHVQRSVEGTEISLLDENGTKLTLRDIIEAEFGVSPKSVESKICMLDNGRDNNGYSYAEKYLAGGYSVVRFGSSFPTVTVSHANEEYEVGTVYKLINNRLLDVLDAVREVLKNNIIDYTIAVTENRY